MRFGVYCIRKGYIAGIDGGEMVAIHSSGQLIFGFTYIKGITLGAGKEVGEVAGGESGMGVDRIGEIGDKANEGQAAGMYGTSFTVVSGGGSLWQG